MFNLTNMHKNHHKFSEVCKRNDENKYTDTFNQDHFQAVLDHFFLSSDTSGLKRTQEFDGASPAGQGIQPMDPRTASWTMAATKQFWW